jgi:hypothetical protein
MQFAASRPGINARLPLASQHWRKRHSHSCTEHWPQPPAAVVPLPVQPLRAKQKMIPPLLQAHPADELSCCRGDPHCIQHWSSAGSGRTRSSSWSCAAVACARSGASYLGARETMEFRKIQKIVQVTRSTCSRSPPYPQARVRAGRYSSSGYCKWSFEAKRARLEPNSAFFTVDNILRGSCTIFVDLGHKLRRVLQTSFWVTLLPIWVTHG